MIGYIYKNIKERIYQHNHVTRNKNTKFGNALRKYGINMFDFNVLVIIHSKKFT